MHDDEHGRVERLMARLDEAMLHAREADRKAEALRLEILELAAKADRIRLEIEALKQSQPPKSPDSN